MLFYPASQATDLLALLPRLDGGRARRAERHDGPMTAPPEPFVPEALQLQPAVGVQICYVGDIETGQTARRAAHRRVPAGRRPGRTDAVHRAPDAERPGDPVGSAGVPQVGEPQGAVRSRHRDHHPLRRRGDLTDDDRAAQLVGWSDQPRPGRRHRVRAPGHEVHDLHLHDVGRPVGQRPPHRVVAGVPQRAAATHERHLRERDGPRRTDPRRLLGPRPSPGSSR